MIYRQARKGLQSSFWWYVYTPLFVYVTDRKTVDKCQQVVSIFLVITGDYTPNFNGNDYTYFFIHKVEIEAIYQKMTSRRRSVKICCMKLFLYLLGQCCTNFSARANCFDSNISEISLTGPSSMFFDDALAQQQGGEQTSPPPTCF